MDLAYLFGNVTDLRAVDIKTHGALAAKTYFGAERLAEQSQTVIEVLAKKGFSDHHQTVKSLRQCLYILCLVQAVLIGTASVSARQQWKWRIIQVLNAAFPSREQFQWAQCGQLIPHVLKYLQFDKQQRLNTEQTYSISSQ